MTRKNSRWATLFCTALISLSLAGPVQANLVDDSFQHFSDDLEQTYASVEAYDYTGAIVHTISANSWYTAFLQVAAKHEVGTPAELWNYNLAMQVDLIRAWVVIGQRLHDKRDYSGALDCYQRAKAINPLFPLSHYEIGFTYFTMGKPWEAALALYEAKRLNRYPSKRQIVNPLDTSFSIKVDRDEFDERIDGLLRDLKKPLDYPVTLNLSTSKQRNAVMVPGIGANLRNRNGAFFNLYLKAAQSVVHSQLGKPEPVFEGIVDDDMPVSYFPFRNTLYTVGINTRDENVYMIQADEPGYSVLVQNQYLSIGEPAEKVIKVLGKSFGFERRPVNQAHIRDMLVYQELGLSIAISKDDKIAALSIWNLD